MKTAAGNAPYRLQSTELLKRESASCKRSGLTKDARLLAFAFFLFVPSLALATSIVAVRTPRSIIIAADSKPTYRGTPGPPTVCKIYRTGRLYFAISGLDYDEARHFFPAQIVASNFSDAVPFNRAVARVESAVKAALLAELDTLKSSDPQTFRFTIKGHDVTSILLAEVRNGIPRLAAREFQYADSPSPHLKVNRITCPGNCPPGNEYVFLGDQAEASQFVKEHRREALNPLALPESLVSLEAKSHPSDVGPPIVVLRLSSRGARWISNDSACPVVLNPVMNRKSAR